MRGLTLEQKEQFTGWSHMYSERRGEISVIDMDSERVMFMVDENECGENFEDWERIEVREYLEENFRDEITSVLLAV